MMNQKSRPNFLVFIVDQMNSFSLGYHGNPDVRTPNIDKLCTEGASFNRAYCSNPVCSPSRATLHTGLTPRQHGLITNGCKLTDQITTLPQVLVDNGFRTHCVGKIHLQPFSNSDFGEEGRPLSWESRDLWNEGVIKGLPLPYYGYQTVDYVGGHVNYVNGDYVNDVEAQSPGTRAKLSRAEAYHSVLKSQAWRMPIDPELHYNHWIVDRSMDFLDSVPEGDNFFLVTSFPDPHHPFAACRPYSEMYDPNEITLPETWNEDEDLCGYLKRDVNASHSSWNETALRESIAQTYGMITHIDDNVGRLLQHLDQTGHTDNTIVISLSDHGEYLGSHHLLLKGKWPYEQVVRVPFIWKDPKASARGRSDQIASLLDFVPTVLDYVEIDQTPFKLRAEGKGTTPTLPGKSLRSWIEGNTGSSSAALVEYDEDFYEGHICRYRMLIESRFKVCLYGGTGQGVLLDLERDPCERHNRWADNSYTNIRNDMLAKLSDRLAWTDRFDTPRYCGA